MHGCCLLCVIWAGIVGFATPWILNRDLRFCRLFPRVYVWVYGHSLQTVFTKSSPARRHTLEILPRKGRPVNCANMTGRLMNIFKTLKICTQGGKVFPCMFMEARERGSLVVSVCMLVCFGGKWVVRVWYEGCLLVYVYILVCVACSFSNNDLL